MSEQQSDRDASRRTLTRKGRRVLYDGRRWRVTVKVGRYRFGVHMTQSFACKRWETGRFGVGIATGNWVRRGHARY